MVLVGTALLVWPGLEHPFSAPKTALLGLGAAMGCAALLWRGPIHPAPRAARILAAGWILSLALTTLLSAGGPVLWPALGLEVASAFWLLALLHLEVDVEDVTRVLVFTGCAVAAVCLLQAAGADPFALAGWEGDHPGARMRVPGTLGNPDFAAAYLGVTACAAAGAWAHRRRPVDLLPVVLQLVALAVTRSWGSVLALGAAGAFAARRADRRTLLMGAGGLAALTVALGLSGRDLAAIVRGRVDLWAQAAPRVLDAPLFGRGAGSVQGHAHCDFLEWSLDFGLVGLGLRLALVALALRGALNFRRPLAVAAGAGLVGLLARAMVDFPLARPAELCLLGVLVSIAVRRERE